jgi:hypothetical protein
VAVGGTMFSEGSGNYWGPANGPNPTVLSHIPENAWNESCSATTCGNNAALWSGGGGMSQFFAKPSWQFGVPGIPSDLARDQPDVSLTAAAHDPYLVCFQLSCANQRIFFFSGTSAAAPSFAAIMAMVVQKTGSRQGQANYVLYRLAAADVTAARKCNGSSTTLPTSACTFNDITIGNNAVPGEAGFGTASGKYQSTTGYDLATGLGSVNVTNLVNNWASATFTPSTTTLVSLSPTTITHGAPVNVQVSVTPGTATGDVSLRNGDPLQLSGSGFIDKFSVIGGSATGTTKLLPGGTYHVAAHYAGDQTLAPSDSALPGILVTVNPEPSAVVFVVSTIDSAGNILPYGTQPYGSVAYLRADVTGASGNGTPSGILNIIDNGLLFSGQPLNSKGTATTAQGYASFPMGPHTLSAHYLGDNSFSSSNSSSSAISVTKAPVTNSLATSSTTVAEGAMVTLIATVATNSFAAGPGGPVTFSDGGTPITNVGNPAPLLSGPGSINIQTGANSPAVGTATLVTSLPIGSNVITAQYPGDTSYNASTSAPVTVNVVADFDFAPAAAPITVTRGSSGTATFTITGHTGYSSTVNFSAASCTGLPAESACTFSAASVVGSGSTTLSIKTTAPKTASLTPLNFWATGSGGIFAGLFLLSSASRSRRAVLALVLFASLTTITACGGGGSSGPPPDPGTPLGTFTVTVKAVDSSGVLSHTATVTLKVQ